MSFAEFWPIYVRAHSRPATRVVHLIGTLGGWMLVGAAIAERRWWWILVAIAVAYGLAWASHFFVEHNMPATFDHPLWSWWADQRMMFLMVTGQMGREVRRYTSPSSRGHRRGAASPKHSFPSSQVRWANKKRACNESPGSRSSSPQRGSLHANG
jgi:hypothetical protein